MHLTTLFFFEGRGFLYGFDFRKIISQAHSGDISKGCHGLDKLSHDIGGVSWRIGGAISYGPTTRIVV